MKKIRKMVEKSMAAMGIALCIFGGVPNQTLAQEAEIVAQEENQNATEKESEIATEKETEAEKETETERETEKERETERETEVEKETERRDIAEAETQSGKEILAEEVQQETENKPSAPQAKEISFVQVSGGKQTDDGRWDTSQKTASCNTEGISNPNPEISYAYASTLWGYMEWRTSWMNITLKTDGINYKFAEEVTGTVNGVEGCVIRRSDTEIEIGAKIEKATHFHSTGDGNGISRSPIPTNYNETEHWYQCQYPSCNDVESTIRDVEPHEFTGKIVGTATLKTERTCTEPAVYYKSCRCGYIGTEETFTFGDPLGHDIPEDAQYESDDTQHWKSCVREGCDWEDREDHTGGTATCKEAAVCDICHESYGEPDPQNHVGGTEVRDAKEATEEEEGYTGDICCASCGEVLTEGKEIPKLTVEENTEAESEEDTEESESESESESEAETESETEEKVTVKKATARAEKKAASVRTGTAVQTGDTTTLTGYVLLAISSLMTFVLALRKKRF